MNITYSARNTDIDTDFRERAEKKLAKYDRFFDDANAAVVVTLEDIRYSVEITIRSAGMIFRGEAQSTEVMEALDDTLTRISRRIAKQRTILRDRFRSGSLPDFSEVFPELKEEDKKEEDEFKVVRTKSFPLKPMFVDEAILQMNLLGHSFFLFANADSGDVNTVYRRNDGNYGLIEPEY